MAKWLEKQYQTSPLGAVVENSMTSGSTVNAPSISAVQNAISNPNLFLNPDFSIWQRGETITVGDTRTYTADRWGVFFKSTVSRNVDGAGMKIVTEAGDYGSVNQYIEFSYETIGLLINKPMTLTVRLRTSRSLNAGIGLVGNDKAITTSTVWTDYTHTFIPKDTDFIWIQDTNSYLLRVNIFSYGSGNLFQEGDIIEIRFAKLEVGSISTPFSPRPYADELTMCKRYYQIVETQGIFGYEYGNVNAYSYMISFDFDEMRIAPTAERAVYGYNNNSGIYISNDGIYSLINKYTTKYVFRSKDFNNRPANYCYFCDVKAWLDAEIY